MTIEYLKDRKDDKVAITICEDKLTIHFSDSATAMQIEQAFNRAKSMIAGMTVSAWHKSNTHEVAGSIMLVTGP